MTIKEAKELPDNEQSEINETLVTRMREQLGDAVKIYSDCIDRLEKIQGKLPELEKLFPDFKDWMDTAEMASPAFYTELFEILVKLLPRLQQYVAEHPGCSMYEIVSRDELLEDKIPAMLQKLDTGNHITDIYFPLDPLNSKIWKKSEADTDTLIKFKANRDKDPELNIYYKLSFCDFDALISAGYKITKKLEPFDERVYMAVNSLYEQQGKAMTIGQIYYSMGYNTKPNKHNRDQIDASLSKMGAARVYVDNEEEAERYKYSRFSYDENLLYFRRITELDANGSVLDGVIEVLKQPALCQFAESRKQYTTLPLEVLRTPLSKTEFNLKLENYLIKRIAQAKSGSSKKILYSTVYEAIGANRRDEHQRCRERLLQLMNYYKKIGYIDGYAKADDSITLKVPVTKNTTPKLKKK